MVTLKSLNNISGFLLDLSSVLYESERPIDGADETNERLKAKKIPCRFTTNTTTCSLATLHQKLAAVSLPIEKNEIFTDHYPREPVHLLIIPKVVTKNFYETPPEILDMLNRYAKMIAEKLGITDHFVVIINNGYGQEIDHIHYHFMSDQGSGEPEVYELMLSATGRSRPDQCLWRDCCLLQIYLQNQQILINPLTRCGRFNIIVNMGIVFEKSKTAKGGVKH